MMLENARLRVEIADLGAELMSVYDKKNETELLFNGDPAYWKRRAPILFPNVGKVFGGAMKINGKTYPAAQHGFARDSVFTLVTAGETHALYLLKSSAETLEKYPFDFELSVSYILCKDMLKVHWCVKNLSDAPMYFTIGGHPAFCFANPSDSKEDYCLEFPNRTFLEYILLDPASGTAIPDKKYLLPLKDHRLALSDALFANDAMIFDDAQIDVVWLCAKDGSRRVGMQCENFPNYGIWSVKGAPFVCLEPWMGRADNLGFDAELSEKPGVNIVEPGGMFVKDHFILLP